MTFVDLFTARDKNAYPTCDRSSHYIEYRSCRDILWNLSIVTIMTYDEMPGRFGISLVDTFAFGVVQCGCLAVMSVTSEVECAGHHLARVRVHGIT